MDLKEKLKIYLRKEAQFRRGFKITSKTAWNPQKTKSMNRREVGSLTQAEKSKLLGSDPYLSGQAWSPQLPPGVQSGGSYGTEHFPYKVDLSVR